MRNEKLAIGNIPLGIAITVFFLLLSACNNPFHKPAADTDGISPGTGRVIIGSEEPQSRTILPDTPVFVSYLLQFQYQGEGEASKGNQIAASLPCSVDLTPGPWLVTVTAYTRIEGVQGLADGNYPAASGSALVTVNAGASVPVTVNLYSGTSMEGQGVLEYNIGLPDESLISAALSVLGMNKNRLTSINLLASHSGSFALDAGYYLVQVQVTTGRVRSKTELIHIYSGHTTRVAGSGWNFNTEEGVYLSVAELSDFLAAAPANTAGTPYPVKLITNLESLATIGGTSGGTYPVNVLGALFEALHGKYVRIDLSEAAGSLAIYTPNPDDGSSYYGSSPITDRNKLVTVVLPDTLTFIPPYTFKYCTSLKSVSFPQSLQKIGEQAFGDPWDGGCTSLLSADMSVCASLTTISNYAFSSCSSLEEVTLPDSVQTIGKDVFSYCASLKEIILPPSLNSLGRGAFSNTGIIKADLSRCSNLQTINWDALFHTCRNLKEVILPLTIGNIPNTTNAFNNCSALDSLTFAGSQVSTAFSVSFAWLKSVDLSACANLATIGTNAFANCASLETVILPDSVTTISANAFQGCVSLKTMPDMPNIQTIGNSVFDGCTGLFTGTGALNLSAYTTLLSIGDNAFRNCTQFTSIVLPSSLQNLGAAFSGCTGLMTGLTNLNLSACIALKTINGSFNAWTGLASIVLPEGLETIGSDSFRNCSALVTINLPGSLKTIGSNAFNSCQMAQIQISGLNEMTSIGPGAFYACAALTLVDLSGCTSLVRIYGNTFNGCSTLASVDLSGCTALTNITTIYSTTFNGCTALTSVNLSGCTALTNLTGGDINTYVFKGCAALEDVDLSGCINLESISESAFSGCSALVSINLAGCTALTSIGNSAFKDCLSLGSVDFLGYSPLASIGNDAFYNCTALETVDLSGCTSLISIGGSAFYNCTALESADLSGCTALVNIGDSTFMNCITLRTIDFSNCAALTAIGSANYLIQRGVFEQCRSLEFVDVTGCAALTTIGNRAFYYCIALPSLDLSSCTALKTIYDEAFYYCISIRLVQFPVAALTSIGKRAFRECYSLESVDLSGCTSITSIGGSAFYSCTALETVDLSGCSTLASIGTSNVDGQTFQGCTALESVDLSGCIALGIINYRAFSGCGALTLLDLSGIDTPPWLRSYYDMNSEFSHFFGTPSNLVIYVPAASVTAYQTAPGWSEYASKIQAKP